MLVPSAVMRRPDGMVTFNVPVAPGASLGETRAVRALTLGECITVGVGIADALAAMHAERLAHGDISAANVIADGLRITLVDTMGAMRAERGTPGFVAPERVEGASPAGDVYALGMLLRFLANADALPVIDAWTAPLIAPEASERPTAAHAAAALARCAPAVPVAPLRAPVTSAMRAGALPRTEATAADRWWRVERTALRLTPLAALAVIGAISGAALVPTVATGLARERAPQRIADPAIPVAAAALVPPDEAAVDLAADRVEALAAGDANALRALSVPGSPAASADAATASSLADGDLAFDGLELVDATARLQRATPGGAIVEVRSVLSGYSVGPTEVPEGAATAVLQLRLTQRGWLVERILPPP